MRDGNSYDSRIIRIVFGKHGIDAIFGYGEGVARVFGSPASNKVHIVLLALCPFLHSYPALAIRCRGCDENAGIAPFRLLCGGYLQGRCVDIGNRNRCHRLVSGHVPGIDCIDAIIGNRKFASDKCCTFRCKIRCVLIACRPLLFGYSAFTVGNRCRQNVEHGPSGLRFERYSRRRTVDRNDADRCNRFISGIVFGIDRISITCCCGKAVSRIFGSGCRKVCDILRAFRPFLDSHSAIVVCNQCRYGMSRRPC